MAAPLRVLIVEDNPDDAELMVLALSRGGYSPDWRRAETADEMRAALAEGAWDIVLSDYTLPQFGALAALRVTKDADPDLPFVVISGTIGEEAAVEAMRAGASDYLLKASLVRLPEAVRREVRESKNRRARRRAERDAAYLAALVRSTDDLIVSKGLDGVVATWNPAAERLLGYTAQEAVGRHISFIVPPDRADELAGVMARLNRGERVEPFETVRLHKNGTRVEVAVTLSPVRDEAGRPVGISKVARDIRGRLRQDAALRASEARFRAMVERGFDVVTLLDTDGTIRYISPACQRSGGRPPAEFLGRSTFDFCEPSEVPRHRAAFQGLVARSGASETWQGRTLHPDGSTRDVESTFTNLLHDPDLRAVVINTRDITEQKRAEEQMVRARAEAERGLSRLRAVVASMAEGLIIADAAGNLLDWNEAALRVHGYSDVAGVRRPLLSFADQFELAVPGKPPLTPREWPMARVLRGESFGSWELRVRRKDTGLERVISYGGAPVFGPGGAVELATLTLHDVTDHRRAEAELREGERRYRELFEANPHPMWVYDVEGLRFLAVNDAAVARYGYSREEFLGMTILDIRPEEDRPALLEDVRRPGRDLSLGALWRHRWKDGTVRDVEIASHAIRYAGRQARLVSAADVTERLRAETALRQSEGMLRAVLETLPVGVWVAGPRGEIVLGNRAGQRIWGGARYVGLEGYGEYKGWWADTGRRVQPHEWALARAVERGEASADEVIDIECFDGSRKTIRNSAAPVRDGEGRVAGAVAVIEDITEKRSLEEQLRQAQKMEAVGQLAGGVAHDFNNLLTVINGYSDLLLRRLPAGDSSRGLIEEIYRAGERSAALTRQLLIFSRKQVVQPRVLDLNEVVAGAEKLLSRVIGEDVRLEAALRPLAGRVKADPLQLEQVLMNLAVNARDAMPQGGRLTIETAGVDLDEDYARIHAGVKAGPYLLLAVSDTGCGMPDEVKARIFEPFFTTKGVGKGTGLGLAVVHGIVKEAGGHVGVYSEVGLGTTFKVYLPRADGPAHFGKPSSHGKQAPKGTETVLLVEDDEGVRALALHVLRGCGYRVLEAADGNEALRSAGQHAGPIHLLLTDVVLPGGLGGRQLAERIHVLYPDARVLYVSGYTDDAVVRHGVLEEQVAFLQKPFSPLALAHKVRELLDGPRLSSDA